MLSNNAFFISFISYSVPEFLFGFRFLISLINFPICLLILFQCSLNCHSEFTFTYWVSSWHIFWIPYQLHCSILWFQVWCLENCPFLAVIQCYCGSSWFLLNYFSAGDLKLILAVGVFLLFSSRWCGSIRFQFLLALLSLVGEWHFASTPVCVRGMTPCLCHHFLSSGALAVASPWATVNHQDGGLYPLASGIPRVAGTVCHWLWGKRDIWRGSRCCSETSTVPVVLRFEGSTTVDGVQEPGGGHLNIWEDGIPDSVATAALVICGWGRHRGSGARVMCAAYLVATGFSKAVGSAVMVRGTRLWALTQLLPWLCLLCVLRFTHLFRHWCMEFSSILLCWVEEPLLSCDFLFVCLFFTVHILKK